jgi:hypothetical protein
MKRRSIIATLAALGGAGAAEGVKFVAGVAGERVLIDPLFAEDDRDPWRATIFPWELFQTDAAPRQRASYAAWRAGQDVVAMLPDIDPAGCHAVISFAAQQARYSVVGHGLTVFDRSMAAGRPVISSPDGHYGRFVYNRAADCLVSGKPALVTCFGPAGDRTIQYLSLMLPVGLEVVSIGYPDREWTAAARPTSGRPGAATWSRRTVATI